MRALVVHCHPDPTSLTAAVRDQVVARLQGAGAEVRVNDLYARGFDPRLTAAELRGYRSSPANQAPVRQDVVDLLWCDTLIFVYPTWWYGLPAMLKGWLDRVFLPGVAFEMPDVAHRAIRPGLQQIRRLGVFTTCGASWGVTQIMGAPGKRTLVRGIGSLMRPGKRVVFAAHYRIDQSTAATRERHLARVARRMDRLIAPDRQGRPHPGPHLGSG